MMRLQFWKKEKSIPFSEFLNSTEFYNWYNSLTVEEQKLTRKKIVMAIDCLDEYRSALEYEIQNRRNETQ